MAVLLVNLIMNQKKTLINSLIPGGIPVFAAENLEQATAYIKNEKIDFIIIDIDHLRIDWLGFLKKTKGDDLLNEYKIFVKTKNNSKEFLTSLLGIGISQLLIENVSEYEFIEKVEKFVGLKGDQENRVYLRIPLGSEDKGYMNFTIRKVDETSTKGFFDTTLEGEIRDVSTVAMAFKPVEKGDLSFFTTGKVIENVNVRLNQKRGNVNLRILKNDDFIIAQYLHVTQEFLSLVSEFIFDKLAKKKPQSKVR